MKRLRVTAVLAVAFGLVATSSVVALWELTASRNGPIATAARERLGDAYLERLLPIEQALPVDRRLAASSDATNPQFAGLEAGLSRDIAALDAFDRQVGAQLQTTDDFVRLRSEWEARGRAADAVQVRNEIQKRLRALEQLVGDTSDLTLDPVLDSYYLVDATVENLPDAVDLLNRLIDDVRGAGGRPPDAATRTDLIGTIALLRSDVARLETDTRVAVAGDGRLGPVLDEPGRVFRRRTTDAIDHVETGLTAAGEGPLSPGLAPDLQQALDAAFALDRASLPTLDGLLRTRVDRDRSRRLQSLMLVGALLLVGLLAGAWALSQLAGRLRRAARALHHAEQADALAHEAGGDEVGDVVAAAAGLLRRLESAAAIPRDAAGSGQASPEVLADENQRLKLIVAELTLANRFRPGESGTRP
jgi:methyl-accepting chemotaxis protein